MVVGTDGRRRRHNASERQAVLGRLASSEKSMSAFCGAESISLATLRRWLSDADTGATPVAGAAVPSGFLELGALGGAITIEVELGGGVVLRVRRG